MCQHCVGTVKKQPIEVEFANLKLNSPNESELLQQIQEAIENSSVSIKTISFLANPLSASRKEHLQQLSVFQDELNSLISAFVIERVQNLSNELQQPTLDKTSMSALGAELRKMVEIQKTTHPRNSVFYRKSILDEFELWSHKVTQVASALVSSVSIDHQDSLRKLCDLLSKLNSSLTQSDLLVNNSD